MATKIAAIELPNMEQAMASLPTANTEITQFFRQWLETFAGHVREVDYASARPLFHPDVLAFGTHNDVISGIDQWIATQWEQCLAEHHRLPFRHRANLRSGFLGW